MFYVVSESELIIVVFVVALIGCLSQGSGTNHTGGLYMAAAAQVQQQALCEYPKGNSVSCYDMCVYCFDVLVNRLKHDQVPRVSTPTFAHANESL